MAKIIITYRLKPEASQADFETWVRTRDYPAMRGLPTVTAFANHRVKSLLLDPSAKPTLDYVEMFDVPDVAAFMASDFPSAAVQAILGEFMGQVEGPEIMVAEEVV